MRDKRYTTFNDYLRRRFGERVQKISVDAGFTCPNRDGTCGTGGCIYCDAQASRAPYCDNSLSIYDQIQKGKRLLGRKYKARKYLVYFQPFSNTYAPLPDLRKCYDEAFIDDDVVGLCVGTRPDCISEEVLDLLAGYGANYMVWIEYGLQTIHQTSLEWLRRGHDYTAFEKAVSLTNERNIPICVHLIVGIPGEGQKEILETVRELVRQNISAVKIHLLHVLKNTELEKEYNKKTFALLSLEEYVSLVCDILEHLPKEILIQRLTSEAPEETLIAPGWTNEKQKILTAIDKEMERRDSWQGKLIN